MSVTLLRGEAPTYIVFSAESNLLPVYRTLMFHLHGGNAVACLFGELVLATGGICEVNGHYGGHERWRVVDATVERGFDGRKDGIMAGGSSTDTYTQLQPGPMQGVSAVESVERMEDHARTGCLERTRIEICRFSVQGGLCRRVWAA